MTLELAVATPVLGGILGAGAIGALWSGRREFVLRALSFAAATPILLTAAATGRIGAAVLAVAIALVCCWEFTRLVALDRWTQTALAAGVVAMIGLDYAHQASTVPLVALLSVAVPVIAARSKDGLSRAMFVGWGLLWLGGSLAVLPNLGSQLVPVAVAVSIGDVAAYFGGSVANRLSPRWPLAAVRLNALSPNKTWLGALTGSAAAVATLTFFGDLRLDAAVAVTAGAVLGDLVESMVKRGSGVKDAGQWLPGFGGLLDRVDSLLGALLVLAVLA